MSVTKDEIETLIRAVLKIGGGYLIAKGFAGHETVDQLLVAGGFASAASAVIHGLFSAKFDALVKGTNK